MRKWPDDFVNKIICGDCLEVMKEMPDKSVDLVLTDPPYGMSYQSSWRTEKHDKIENDDSLDWFPDFIKECYRVLKDNSHCYLFCNDYSITDFRKQAEQAGFNPKRTLVWVKNNHTSGDLYGDYGNKTEFIVFLEKGRKHLNGKRECNVIYCDRDLTELHPTKKPEKLIGYLALKSSNESDIVFDPFSGSGTTAVACKDLKRNFIGIEKEPKYVEIAKNRLAELDRNPTLF